MTFPLGHLTATRRVADLMGGDMEFNSFVWRCLTRYKCYDWGDLTDSDKAMNDEAVKTGDDRVLAAYDNLEHPDWRLWIITECDRSYTTILFPDEY